MRNVTITVDDEVLRWARIRAAEQDTSVSRLLGEFLREMMAREDAYRVAMQAYLGRPARMLNEPGAPYPSREELHDRPGLR